MNDSELLIKTYTEIDRTLNRLFTWRKQLTEMAEQIDGDIAALKTLMIEIESKFPHEESEAV